MFFREFFKEYINEKISVSNEKVYSFQEIKADFEKQLQLLSILVKLGAIIQFFIKNAKLWRLFLQSRQRIPGKA